jgi:hypothetical protein
MRYVWLSYKIDWFEYLFAWVIVFYFLFAFDGMYDIMRILKLDVWVDGYEKYTDIMVACGDVGVWCFF